MHPTITANLSVAFAACTAASPARPRSDGDVVVKGVGQAIQTYQKQRDFYVAYRNAHELAFMSRKARERRANEPAPLLLIGRNLGLTCENTATSWTQNRHCISNPLARNPVLYFLPSPRTIASWTTELWTCAS